MNFIELKKPVNTLKPSAGKLLIAEPFLADPNFSRSVILICEHSDEGTVGFILNNTTDLILGDLLPDLHMSHLPIYQGGPVQMDTLHMLHRHKSLGGAEIAKDIYWGGSYETLQDMIIADSDLNDLCLYVGYSGWSPGQLDKELNEGSWLVIDTSLNFLFDIRPDQVWKYAIKTLGKEYEYLANMPLDPMLN